ncbi:DNA-3-methyladenine glycosylase [Rhodomicrobium sp. Az07]|uniref:DNA-3-methyladenine glycosylase n=1 Tax=Rhodomicrobium sp. Az07 TaxID=2839034 RepID=UPI001BE772C5|nr:DNA-3-methyladenine glycosylase [Rhodomicrobium sp. Az07]MBT3069713.1 DNA-3-methyladenine glycosylase [Rhodomicrobium sp. Az07]
MQVIARPISRDELPADTANLARFLIGKLVLRALPDALAVARIVETEAYLADDAACHAFRGPTPRNRAMFGPPGHAYVYRAYGVCWMLNVTNAAVGVGEAVLIRAAEPLSGLDAMQRHRGDVPTRDLLRGPGRLAGALAIDRSHDGADLCARGALWLGADGGASGIIGSGDIGTSTRIGITRDAHLPLRFYLKGSRFLSGPAALNGQGKPRSGSGHSAPVMFDGDVKGKGRAHDRKADRENPLDR